MALFQPGVRIKLRLPRAPVPNLDRTRPVLPFGYVSFKGAVREGMILGSHSQPLIARLQAGAFRHGPAEKNTVQLQTEIVVKASRVVLLNDVTQLLSASRRPAGRRFRSLLEVALPLILFERHL